MKSKFAVLVLAIGGLVALGAFTSQDEVLLRRTLTTGDKDTYTVQTRMEMTMDMGEAAGMESMPMDMSTSMKMDVEIGTYDEEKKEAVVTMHIRDINYDMGEMGQMGGMAGGPEGMPDEFELKGKLDERNRLKSVRASGEGMMFQMMNQSMNSMPVFIEFPEEAVKPGDSWKVTIPKNPMFGDEEVKLDATLIGLKSTGIGEAYAISLKGEIPMDMDLGKMMEEMGGEQANMMGGMSMLMTGTIEVNGEVIVEKETGRTIKVEAIYKSDTKMEMPDFGMTMDMIGNTQLKMVLDGS